MKTPGKLPLIASITLLTAASVGRLWLERDLTDDLRQEKLLPMKLDVGVRDEMGQEAFAAALGGMRAILASFYELEAFDAFSQDPSVWHKVDQYYALCTKLQPLYDEYWEQHAWMLHSNMSEDYGSEGLAYKGTETEWRAYYRELGLQKLLKGLEFIPDSLALNRAVATFYSFPHPVVNPHPNHEKAAEYYLRASKCADALPWMYRFHAMQLSYVKGREQEAYDKLMALYNASEKNRFPGAIGRIKQLETQLNVPADKRIPDVLPTRKPSNIPMMLRRPPGT